MKLIFKWNKDSHLRAILAINKFSRLWDEQQKNMLAAFYEHTGLKFKQKQITIRMHEDEYASNYSGNRYEPMTFNLEYQDLSDIDRLQVLSHELGHRLLEGNRLSTWAKYKNDEDKFTVEGHKLLYLFLYDVWVSAFGQETADKMAEEEARVKDKRHNRAWKWAMSKSYAKRQALIKDLVQSDR